MAAVKFSKQLIQPNPLEVDYWVDISKSPYGAIIKYHDGDDWVQLNGSGGSASDFDFYTKTQINQMLANKADVSSVESKVDDDELAEVIKNIEIKDIGDSEVQLILFKYDNTQLAVSMPVATSTNPGILSQSDFIDFVKQHQLQELYTEMYDLFKDIRAKYQPKLVAGRGIEIAGNVISASKDLDFQWDDVSEEDRAEIVGDLKKEIKNDVQDAIDDLNTAIVNAEKIKTAATEALNKAETAEELFTSYSEQLGSFQKDINSEFDNFRLNVRNDIQDINIIAIDSANKAEDAATIANAAKDAVATLEGLSNADTSTITAAQIVTQVSQNTLDIQNILSKEVILTSSEFDALETKDPTVKYYIYE